MNNKKRLFVVSDIHGHYTLLKEALNKAGFDKDNPEHLLICCGDYFERGNENLEVYFETENYVFVHGWLPENIENSTELQSADDNAWAQARWIKWTEKYDGKSPLTDKTLIRLHYGG